MRKSVQKETSAKVLAKTRKNPGMVGLRTGPELLASMMLFSISNIGLRLHNAPQYAVHFRWPSMLRANVGWS